MNCQLCPNEERIHPEPVFEGPPPMSTLMCGHQVHTHCLLNEMANHHVRAVCGTCNQRIIEERVITFYDMYERPGNGRTVARLWAESEEFRNDIKELKKRQLKYNKIKREFNSAANTIKARFLENIRTSLEIIKDQRQSATNEYKRIQSKRMYTTLGNSCVSKLNQIRGTYGLGLWELREQLANIEGAPKFPQTGYYRWRSNPRYFFRVKL